MTITHAMLGNAAVAAVLALLALAVGCACRSAAVRHVAWVLVLLKLVTPPLFSVPLPVLPASRGTPIALENPKSEIRNSKSETNTKHEKLKSETAPPGVSNFGYSDLGFVSDFGFRISEFFSGNWALAVWAAGAAGWFIWQGRRIVRFRRRVGCAEDAGPEVSAAARRIASALGVARPPAVKAATGISSPMLWGWGRSTVILFPSELLARLAPEARDTLLAHELAHFLRRDHWVRVLEFVATGLYWWHPAVWLARASIEAAEEECCDAWVVGGLAASPRRYAEALLATVDYVAEVRRPCLPPGACGANRGARLLHRRLVGIIHAKRPRRFRAAVAVRAAVVALLLIQPVLRAATQEPELLGQESGVTNQESGVVNQVVSPDSWPLIPDSLPPKSAEPRAWASASAPGGAVTAVARDNEVVLRRPDGTEKALGPGRPLALAFAPDGKRLATAGPGPLVRAWDYQGNLLAEASVPAAARGIAYTPDGDWLLVLDAAGGISVRDPHTLAPVTGWSVEGPANSIACAPDGRRVAVAFGSWLAERGWVECWSIAEQRKLATYEMTAPAGATRFAPDGSMLIIGGWNGLLAWRTLPGGELVAERQLPKGVVAAAAFSPDAETLPLQPPQEPTTPTAPVPLATPAELFQGVGHLPKR